ncbi:MAG: hypothetical protein ACP5F6_02280 [Microbacter sp.]
MKSNPSLSTSDSNFNFDENIQPEPEFESAQEEENAGVQPTESSGDILPEVNASDDLAILGDEIPNT